MISDMSDMILDVRYNVVRDIRCSGIQSCLAPHTRDLHCSRVGKGNRVKRMFTRVRTISIRAALSSVPLLIHCWTFGHQDIGIDSAEPAFDVDAVEPAFDLESLLMLQSAHPHLLDFLLEEMVH